MPISEAMLRSWATAQSYQRGKDYYERGAVLELSKRGNTLRAQVEGSSYEPYQVTVELGEVGRPLAACSCPYDWGGYCKHIVAAMLAYVREPEQVIERRPVGDLLADLGRDDLLKLLADLLSKQPHLVDWVELRLATQTASAEPGEAGQPRQRRTPIDAEAFRKQAQYAIRSHAGEEWSTSSSGVGEIRELVEQARPFVEVGDGRNALLILEGVAEVFVKGWHEVDYEGTESGMLFARLGSLFAEALLSADFSAEEREAWADRLTDWQARLDDYGFDEGLDAAIGAAVQGWDYPPLQAVLQGHITNKGAWEAEAPWYADDLALARLRVLERQGRTAEYLYLAEAEGQSALYLTMLVKLGRGQEAVDYAMQYMATADEALALAKALWEHGQTADALKIGERGLDLFGETLSLAHWLRDAAHAKQPDLALRAAHAAFARSHSLEDYQAAQVIAGEGWPSVKLELLGLLASADYAYYKIDIYLYEGMVDEAIQTVDSEDYAGYAAVEQVVDAVWRTHPDWAIRQCRKQAEGIMNGGKAKYYEHAVRWLAKARQAYLEAGREKEWRAYLEETINKHARKYSLRPQLEALRG